MLISVILTLYSKSQCDITENPNREGSKKVKTITLELISQT